jgi:hypothetical protein
LFVRSQTPECGNWAAQFPEKEYINGNFVAVIPYDRPLPDHLISHCTLPLISAFIFVFVSEFQAEIEK